MATKKQEPIEAEVVQEPAPTQALEVRGPLAIDVAGRMDEWRQYQELTKQLLDASDYQSIGKKKFKKKSAWRKYSRAFSLSEVIPLDAQGRPDIDAVVQVVLRADDGYPLVSRAFSTFEDRGGRRGTGYHEVHVKEKCCPTPCPRSRWDEHKCCGKDCDGRQHWSHPGDLPATAHTRAQNRAISNLIGAGEVSAEEMEPEAGRGGERQGKKQEPKGKQPASDRLADYLLRGCKMLSDVRPDRPDTTAIVREFTAFDGDEVDEKTGKPVKKYARDLDQLIKSAGWAGRTWNSLRAALVESYGAEVIDKAFPHGGN